MLPVTDLEGLKAAWLVIENQRLNFTLYGFLMYSNSDTVLVEYMRSGLEELEYLSGSDCGIFVIEAPSAAWFQIARKKDNPWRRIFGEYLQPSVAKEGSLDDADQPGHDQIVPDSISPTVLSILRLLFQDPDLCKFYISSTETVTLRNLLTPHSSSAYNRSEIWGIAGYFGIPNDRIPCLMFFVDLNDSTLSIQNLSGIVSQHDATIFFRRFFGSREFKKLLEDARRVRIQTRTN